MRKPGFLTKYVCTVTEERLKLMIQVEEESYYLCSENKVDDQLCSFCESAPLFSHMQNVGFLMTWLIIKSKMTIVYYKTSRSVRKPDFCLCENKDADQLRGNREADQRLYFRYTDSTFPPLLIPKFSRFWVSSVTVQAGLCRTWSEIPKTGFLASRLKHKMKLNVCNGMPNN